MARLRKRLAIDCDGVMSDFASSALNLIHAQFGERYELHHITEYDIFDALNLSDSKHILDNAVINDGFCQKLKVFDGVKLALDELRTFMDVVCVTAPYNAKSWDFERREWLFHLSFKKKEIVQTSGKHLIGADIFIDDNIDYLIEWKAEHNDKIAVIWDQPWNRNFNDKNYVRLSTWNDVIELARSL